MNFHTLKLDPRLERGINDRGYIEMTPVQERTLAATLTGRDVAVQSQTGTGKTAAFLITLFERRLGKKIGNKALIVVPTRELAVQIEGEAKLLNRHLGMKIGCFFGGVGYAGQMESLKRGVDIVIGTPGRLLDFSHRGHLNLKDMGFLVIDEADRLFDMGFLPDLRKILSKLPPPGARQSMLFSATLNRFSQRIAAEHMDRPLYITLTPERLTVDTIQQELYHVKSHIKLNLMLGTLKTQAPQNVLIFSNTRHKASQLALRLKRNGFESRHLTGDLPQNQRLKIIEQFSAGNFSHLVATDVAARGLHIEGLEMVINYDIPQDCENYVHRIGRTARAGKIGKAITLASEGTADHLEAIESFIGMKIPVQEISNDLYASDLSCADFYGNRFRRQGTSDGGRNGKRVHHSGRNRYSGQRRPASASASPAMGRSG